MSTRQNKKRKGRNNVNNRERTVTTLTEDPNTPYLIPTPSEEPAGANLMSSPFSVASSSGTNPNTAAFQIPANFGFGFNNYIGPIHGNVHHQQHGQQFYPQSSQPILPPGQSDLEVLEKLKDIIKNGQHEFYRAVPQPLALASIYLGPANQSQVPHHPEQGPSDYQGPGYSSYDNPAAAAINPISTSPTDPGRRPLRIQTKDTWEAPGVKKPVGPPTGGGSQMPNNVLSAPSPDISVPPADPLQFLQSNQSSIPQTPINRYSMPNNDRSPSVSIKPGHPPDSATPTASAVSDIIPSSQRPKFEPTPNTNGGRPPAGQAPIGNQKHDQRSTGESTYGTRSMPSDISPTKSFDIKEEAGVPRWPHRDGPPAQDDRRPRQDSVSVLPPSRPAANNVDLRPAVADSARPPPPRDQRFNDRERDRDRDHDRDRDRDWERERDRDRRPDTRFRDDHSRAPDVRRALPEQRHYEPRYNDPPSRRYDPKPKADELMSIDRRPDPPRPADDRAARPTLIDDRPFRPPTDDRAPPARASIPDAHPIRVPPGDDRHARPGPGDDRRGPSTDDRTNRPQATVKPAEEGVSRVTAGDDRDSARGTLHPASAAEDRNARPTVPLGERISRVPSLQDRLSQPPSSARVETNRPTRQPSLETRLSHPTAPADHAVRTLPTDDRATRPPSSVPDRGGRLGLPDDRARILTEPPRALPSQDDRERAAQPEERSGRTGVAERDRYVRPITPVQDRGPPPLPRSTGYTRSASVSRDDSRLIKNSPSPVRDFRVAREPSRERPDPRSGYRPEHDRGFNDDRRTAPAAMDLDTPPRFAESRPYTRPFTPPSAADLARDRARSFYANSPPPRGAPEAPPYDVDSDRRYPPPPGDRRDWPPYTPQAPFNDRRRSQPEEDLYWKMRRPSWDRNGTAPIDRDRFDRDVPPPAPSGRSNGWETREERERRSFPGGGSPPRSFDGAQRPLSSRLTDGYPGPGPGPSPDDRSYPPPLRDSERSRYLPPSGPADTAPPPFSRVRQRSPSPVRRRPALGPGGADDMRPPMKRAREDPPYRQGYYPPSPQAPSLNRDRRGSISGDYPARLPTPSPSGGSNYYDRPPPVSSGSGNATGPDDRDFLGRDRGSGMDYGPAPSSYDRPRSPLPSSRLPPTYGRGGYGRGGDPRDDRRYNNMAPPPPRTA